ncbi:putative bifunctional diguanylate cyclase/phosphodiesterase [Propionivibrio dicarboxylicus]|uniref:Diguanylate cyclase (GGDEF) domain-containing protein n=1 Tax=Propionivibrio dicarboxylicus TaxID=83767 RepID=A0A1G8G8U7_9RHOO|nr:EAL domain-containing protein [Propionivibrio dicarboxylicus]SDH90815.1 diguanylate cyclase (GGDEF) domain-containing protein [Propionivibrio dicarboxylicus]
MEYRTHERLTHRQNLMSTGLALFIAFALLLGYQYVSGRRQLSAELNTEAAIIGANCAAALVFNDRQAAQEILEATRLSPWILSGALYRADGKLLASVNDFRRLFPQQIGDADPSASVDAAEASLPIFNHLIAQQVFQDRAPVGTLMVVVTYESLYVKMLEYLVGMVAIGTLAFLLTQRFTAGLRRKMALTEEQLEQMALYDRITGLPNRRFFERELQRSTERIQREGKPGALLLMDVDDFKKVNDLCGHVAGDHLLFMITERLKKTLRPQDIIARVGGDEFAVILYDVGSPEKTAMVAESMITAMAAPFATTPVASHVGLSIGITMIPGDSDDPATLMRWSEMAMYVAKSEGKNGYQFFSEEINDKVHGELHIEADLRKALRQQGRGLWVAYQPQVDTHTRRLVGVEALMRWNNENGQAVSPGEFIPIAEKTGLITELGGWLLNRICEDLAALRADGIELPKISVNLSPRELREGKTIVDVVLQALKRFGEKVDHFQFEVTENALLADNGPEALNALRQAGFALAIDDFGSGYSSLGYLKRFQVSALKIDRQFIERLPDDEEDAVIVTAVIQMSIALGVKVVAEGVETEAQAEFLSRHGCDVLQGYLTGRPMPPNELASFLRAAERTGRAVSPP